MNLNASSHLATSSWSRTREWNAHEGFASDYCKRIAWELNPTSREAAASSLRDIHSLALSRSATPQSRAYQAWTRLSHDTLRIFWRRFAFIDILELSVSYEPGWEACRRGADTPISIVIVTKYKLIV